MKPALLKVALDRGSNGSSSMLFRPLGQTGLNVSLLGLGTGTRFGDLRIQSQFAATNLVRCALELGINYIDTAAMYLDAEAMLGEALAAVPRESYVLATKFFPADEKGRPITPAQLRASVDQSLTRLRLEHLDVLQIHGMRPHWHEAVMGGLGAELDRLKTMGKYRFLGVAETIVEDPRHEMLPLAAPTGRFASALVGYNLLSPWAELDALPACARAGMGVVGMVAVRRALRDPGLLARLVQEARARGDPGIAALSGENPLEWLLDGDSPTLAAAGYRFVVSHPGISCVLAGTLNLAHLKANIAAVCAPPLPNDQLAKIRAIFLHTDPVHWKPFNL